MDSAMDIYTKKAGRSGNADDKRVIKTKRNLKATLAALLKEKSFESITVSEICRRGDTSRITFYNYYDSKYALVEEMFEDYVTQAGDGYHVLQLANNPDGNTLGGYKNLLECIMNLYEGNYGFFAQVTPERNPYLFSAFTRHIFAAVEDYIERHTAQMVPRYTPRQTAALLCGGLWSVISECYSGSHTREEIYTCVRSMYRDILTSAIFVRT